MAMIEVKHLQKNFVKTVKEPGLKGPLRSFIHPEKQTFEAVKDLTFEVPKGQILGFIGANGAGKSTTIKMLTGILKPTSGFCRINGKIPQDNRQDYVKDIGVVFGQRTQLWWDLALQETYTVLKEIYDVPDSLFHKRMDFLNEVLDLKDFIKDPVIIREKGSGTKKEMDIFLENAGIEPSSLNVVARMNDLESIKKSIVNGLGFSILSARSVVDLQKTKQILLFPLEESAHKRTFYIVYSKNRILKPHVRQFIRFVQNFYRTF